MQKVEVTIDLAYYGEPEGRKNGLSLIFQVPWSFFDKTFVTIMCRNDELSSTISVIPFS